MNRWYILSDGEKGTLPSIFCSCLVVKSNHFKSSWSKKNMVLFTQIWMSRQMKAVRRKSFLFLWFVIGHILTIIGCGPKLSLWFLWSSAACPAHMRMRIILYCPSFIFCIFLYVGWDFLGAENAFNLFILWYNLR